MDNLEIAIQSLKNKTVTVRLIFIKHKGTEQGKKRIISNATKVKALA